jgi:hypothetical protein
MKQVVWSTQLQLSKIGPYIHITGTEHAVFDPALFIFGLYAENSSSFCYVVESTLKTIIEFKLIFSRKKIVRLSAVDQHSQNVCSN